MKRTTGLRIGIATPNRAKVGGIEQYLNAVIPALQEIGHEVAVVFERSSSGGGELMTLPADVQAWSVETDGGETAALRGLKSWCPDIIYSHGVHSRTLEAGVMGLAPSVFFAHVYHGACISGSKAFQWPQVRPCDVTFGPGCLVRYLPRRCGGRSPITMFREYVKQRDRLELMRRYDAVITHSGHVRDVLSELGLAPETTLRLPYCGREELFSEIDALIETSDRAAGEPWRLLYLGRLENAKGGRVLLNALPAVVDALGQSVHLTIAGRGSERAAWESHASVIRSASKDIAVTFAGWINHEQVDVLLDASDLLVVPSLWPEPFGLVGLEAGRHGLPVAAFDVGGIAEWLADGKNGRLASGTPPTAAGLAGAIIGCLDDRTRLLEMRRAARSLSLRFNMRDHLSALCRVFDTVLLRAPRACS